MASVEGVSGWGQWRGSVEEAGQGPIAERGWKEEQRSCAVESCHPRMLHEALLGGLLGRGSPCSARRGSPCSARKVVGREA